MLINNFAWMLSWGDSFKAIFSTLEEAETFINNKASKTDKIVKKGFSGLYYIIDPYWENHTIFVCLNKFPYNPSVE